MLNIHELERDWIQYKIKSFIPHALTLIGLIFIATFLFVLDLQNTTNEKEITTTPKKIEQKAEIKVVEQVSQEILVPEKIPVNTAPQKTQELNTSIKEFIPAKEKLLIKPSMDFIRTMQDNMPEYYKEEIQKPTTSKIVSVIPVVKKEEQKVFTPKIEELVLDTKVEEIIPETKEIKIKRQNTQDDIEHVIKRFKQSNNPALSLFIAKKYYEAEDYNQAYNYALVTNEINKDIEESWIIFAKSLFKLNQQEKAMEMLNRYIESSNSQKAKILLDNIKAGKVK